VRLQCDGASQIKNMESKVKLAMCEFLLKQEFKCAQPAAAGLPVCTAPHTLYRECALPEFRTYLVRAAYLHASL